MFRRIAAVKPFYHKSQFDSFARTNAERVQRISKKRALGVKDAARDQPFSTDPMLVSGQHGKSRRATGHATHSSRPSTAGTRVGGGGRARPRSALRRGAPSDTAHGHTPQPSPYLPHVQQRSRPQTASGLHAMAPTAGAFTSGLLTVTSPSRGGGGLPVSPLRQSTAASAVPSGTVADVFEMAQANAPTSTRAFMQHAQHLMATAQASAAASGSSRPHSSHGSYREPTPTQPQQHRANTPAGDRFPSLAPRRPGQAPQASASRLAAHSSSTGQLHTTAQQASHSHAGADAHSPPSGLFTQSLLRRHQVASAGDTPHTPTPPPKAMNHAVFTDFLRSAAAHSGGEEAIASSPHLTGNASAGASLTTYGSMSSDGGIIDDDSPAPKQRPLGQQLAPSPTDEQFEHLERYKAPPTAATEGRGGARPTSARSRHGSARPSSHRAAAAAAGGIGAAVQPDSDSDQAHDTETADRVEYVPPRRRSPRTGPPPSAPRQLEQQVTPLISDSDSDDAVQQLSALPASAPSSDAADTSPPLHINAPPPSNSLSASGSFTSPHRFIRRPPEGTPTPHGTKLCGHTCDMQFLHLCCSCSDKRGWQTMYLKYVDGVGDVAGQSRGEHYCPSCAQHWDGRDLVAWEDEEAEVEAAYKRVLQQASQDKEAAAAAKDMAAARRARVLSTGSADDRHLLSAEAAAKQQARAAACQEDALATFDGGVMMATMFQEDEEDCFAD